MITSKEVESIHEILIERFGGRKGIRDKNLLESSINRPYQGFGQLELYPGPIDKAAAIFESIVSNHPFIDGNKRTAYVLMRLFLNDGGLDINATEEDKYSFVISSASGELILIKSGTESNQKSSTHIYKKNPGLIIQDFLFHVPCRTDHSLLLRIQFHFLRSFLHRIKSIE